MSFWRVVAAVTTRDLRAEWRGREVLSTLALFSLLTVVVFVFSFDPSRHAREMVVPGTLWTSLYFAGLLGFSRSADRDARGGMLEQLRLSPADRGAVYVGKCLSHSVFLLAALVVVLPLMAVWFDLDGRHLTGPFFLLVALGLVAFVAVGTLFALVSSKSRLREVMLPVLLLPVLTPVVRAAVEGCALVISEGPWREVAEWVKVLAAFDGLFLVAGFLLYGHALEE